MPITTNSLSFREKQLGLFRKIKITSYYCLKLVCHHFVLALDKVKLYNS